MPKWGETGYVSPAGTTPLRVGTRGSALATTQTGHVARRLEELTGRDVEIVRIRTDGDEGLFASYSDVQFRAPVRAGDVIEVSATLVRVGSRSREMDFEVRVVGRGAPERGASAADVLDPPVVATTARGVVVVPPAG